MLMVTTLADVIRQSSPIVLVTHPRPDGDGLGSLLGMYHALSRTFPNKRIFAYCPEGLSSQYAFLPGFEAILTDEKRLPKKPALDDCSGFQ